MTCIRLDLIIKVVVLGTLSCGITDSFSMRFRKTSYSIRCTIT